MSSLWGGSPWVLMDYGNRPTHDPTTFLIPRRYSGKGHVCGRNELGHWLGKGFKELTKYELSNGRGFIC